MSRRRSRRSISVDFSNVLFIIVAALFVVLFARTAFGFKGTRVKVNSYDHLNEGYIEEKEEEILYIYDEEPKTLQVDYNIDSKDGYVEEVNSVSWNSEDRDYLIKVLTGEAQTMSYENQIKYGSIVLNRVASEDFPNSIKEVVLDKKHGIQYACFYDGNAYREATETTIKAAEYLLANGSIYPDNVIYQAEFKQGSGVYEKCGNTYFCYE